MMTLGKGDGRPVVGLDLGRVVGGCSQQIIHDRLCAKSRLRRIETDVERAFVGASINRESPNRCVRRNRGETMDTRAGLQVNFDLMKYARLLPIISGLVPNKLQTKRISVTISALTGSISSS